jgi:4-hydroxybenzoyl-CoA reductase subunit beta
VPRTLMSLRGIAELSSVRVDASAVRLGSCVTLTEITGDARFRNGLTALRRRRHKWRRRTFETWPRWAGTLCLETRCNYYDQSYEWRKAIQFCMKKDGTTCWVAPGKSEVYGGVVDRHSAGANGAGRACATGVARKVSAKLRCRPV